MSNRPDHKISPEANEQICRFFERFLKRKSHRSGLDIWK
jgi:hypothetical protein